jgi:hypothetical protein
MRESSQEVVKDLSINRERDTLQKKRDSPLRGQSLKLTGMRAAP